MGRSANKTRAVKIPATDQHIAYFEQLMKKGVYGGSWAEVALSLVNDQIKKLRADGELKDPN